MLSRIQLCLDTYLSISCISYTRMTKISLAKLPKRSQARDARLPGSSPVHAIDIKSQTEQGREGNFRNRGPREEGKVVWMDREDLGKSTTLKMNASAQFDGGELFM